MKLTWQILLVFFFSMWVQKFWMLGNANRYIGFPWHDIVLDQQMYGWFIGNHLKEMMWAWIFCMLAYQTKNVHIWNFFDHIYLIQVFDILYFIGWYSDAGQLIGDLEYGHFKFIVSGLMILWTLYKVVE